MKLIGYLSTLINYKIEAIELHGAVLFVGRGKTQNITVNRQKRTDNITTDVHSKDGKATKLHLGIYKYYMRIHLSIYSYTMFIYSVCVCSNEAEYRI